MLRLIQHGRCAGATQQCDHVMARKTRLDRDLERQQHQHKQGQLPGTPHATAAPFLTIAPAASNGNGTAPALPVSDAPPSHPAPAGTPQRRSQRLAAAPATVQAAMQQQAAAALTETLALPDKLPEASPFAVHGPQHEEKEQQAAATRTTCRQHADDASTAEWSKVLWKEQPVPDNFVHETFLVDLVVNARLPTRQYVPVVIDALAASQQLSLALAAVLAPLHLHAGSLTAPQLLLLDGCMLTAGYGACRWLGHVRTLPSGTSLARVARQGVLLVGGIYLLSPLLKTLAATVSHDSVIALTVAALLVHLFLHDYSFINRPEAEGRLCGRVALAAAALSAVLVASLMPSETHVFAQVLFALELFLLSPFVRRAVRAAGPLPHALLSLALLLLSTWALGALPQLRHPHEQRGQNFDMSIQHMLAHLLPTALQPLVHAPGVRGWLQGVRQALDAVVFRLPLLAYVAAHVLLALVCPWALVRITKYKTQINGPWDEAVPHIPEHLAPSLTAHAATLSAALPALRDGAGVAGGAGTRCPRPAL